jgi:hypothetical protein
MYALLGNLSIESVFSNSLGYSAVRSQDNVTKVRHGVSRV